MQYSMAGNYYFAIVGDKDNPIFEMEISPPSKEAKVSYFALHFCGGSF